MYYGGILEVVSTKKKVVDFQTQTRYLICRDSVLKILIIKSNLSILSSLFYRRSRLQKIHLDRGHRLNSATGTINSSSL